MERSRLIETVKQAENHAIEKPTEPPLWIDSAVPVAFDGRKVEVEFYCSMCKHYIYIKINTGLEGNHIMHCPVCDHEHFRVVVNGIITSDRHDKGKAIVDEIICTKAAAVPADQRRVRGNISVIREMEACGLLK
jgi:hypothetical protein